MPSESKVEVRGIYSTALTKLLSESFQVVRASKTLANRFRLNRYYEFGDVSIKDRIDMQGVQIVGEAEAAESVIKILRKKLLDIVVREKTMKGYFGYSFFETEFPALSKNVLDALRGEVVPTLRHHHKLRIFASKQLDEAENLLSTFPEKRKELEASLERIIKYAAGEKIVVEHVKLDGRLIDLDGEIVEVEADKILKIKRTFTGKGHYNGLDIRKDEGDYAITDLIDSSWITHHVYHSKDGKTKGEFYNINTPIEFYPGKARYVDLEVDVIRPIQGTPYIIDLELLEHFEKEGYITKNIADQVSELAEKIKMNIKDDPAIRFLKE